MPFLIGVSGTVTKGFNKGTGWLGNKKTIRDHPNHSII